MTLVLNVATPIYSLHVSDRLVSKGGLPHDPLANKTVVLRAADGLLALGYTALIAERCLKLAGDDPLRAARALRTSTFFDHPVGRFKS